MADQHDCIKLFPVLFGATERRRMIELGCPNFVRWECLSEGWAYQNHSQTLTRLAQRGGLDPSELAANIEKREYKKMSLEDAVAFIKKYTP